MNINFQNTQHIKSQLKSIDVKKRDMPSFNCDGCGDVIKKPKLDSHSYRCQSSFTCLDCSITFRDSSTWKSHTSCITEAEKFEKSVYKGPKGPKEPKIKANQSKQTFNRNTESHS
ncbi:uncharacterized protein MELLADRAFT_95482 [Melampsora larici-populina 98AG31]|uniref:Zinc finger C2H2 LYAR-type domain-containing protein n=1 Tax=Melampsora larici-populina (strain 98AG31 / pathotype 3-4-7) TaxID=747676 RepID=F4S9H8_MELLP|nr:uncharacterized protein MELLADRAFT_95482 [Melampsora larici-populina 98AG31]EGF98728.1 hypothetical protein MELLADRAFT_95482 [Melampsora larici-populina 98AG31]